MKSTLNRSEGAVPGCWPSPAAISLAAEVSSQYQEGILPPYIVSFGQTAISGCTIQALGEEVENLVRLRAIVAEDPKLRTVTFAGQGIANPSEIYFTLHD